MSYQKEHTTLMSSGDWPPNVGNGSWLKNNLKYVLGGTIVLLLVFLGVSAMNSHSSVHHVARPVLGRTIRICAHGDALSNAGCGDTQFHCSEWEEETRTLQSQRCVNDCETDCPRY